MKGIMMEFLRVNHYDLANTDFQLQLTTHPDFPYVRAITDTLDHFGIENIAGEAAIENLDDLPRTFLALFKESEEMGYAMVEQRKNGLRITNEALASKRFTTSEFEAKWSGRFVAVHPGGSRAASSSGKWSSILIVALVACILFTMRDAGWPTLAIILSSIAGLYISSIMLMDELGRQSRITQSLCSIASSGNSCGTVSRSKSAVVLKYFSLGGLAGAYFGTQILLSITSLVNAGFYLMSLAPVAIVGIYSLYTQAVSIKRWCTLCLFILTLIVGQLATGILFLPIPATLGSWATVAIVAAVSSAAIMNFWETLKRFLSTSFASINSTADLLKLKRNEVVFNAMLDRKPLNRSLPKEGMIFGDERSSISIAAVINPFCGHCARTFDLLDQLLRDHRSLRVTLLLNVPSKTFDDYPTELCSKIVNQYRENGRDACLKELRTWFANPQTGREQVAPVNVSPANIDLFVATKEWCRANKIFFTPTVIVNDRVFPIEYSFNDMQVILGQVVIAAESRQSQESRLELEPALV